MEEIFKLAANYGFPTVVAGYLLIKIEPVMKDLQKSINENLGCMLPCLNTPGPCDYRLIKLDKEGVGEAGECTRFCANGNSSLKLVKL